MKRLSIIFTILLTIFAIQVIIIRSQPKVVMPEGYFAQKENTQAEAPEIPTSSEISLAGDTQEEQMAVVTRQQPPFELLGTLIAGGNDRIAYMKDLQTGAKRSYKIGTAAREYTVTGIALREVSLEASGATYVLKMKDTAGTIAETEEIVDKPFIEITEGRMLVKKAALRPEFGKLVSNARSIKVQPYYQNKAVAGLQVEGISEESVFAQAGLRNQDVIKSVNNQRVDSYQKALQLAHRARTQKEVKLTLIRNGEEKQIAYSIE